MLRFVDDMSDSIVSVSHAIEKSFPKGMQAKRVVIHNGLDNSTSLPPHESKQWLQSLGCKPNKKIALTIGNFIPEKGHSELLEIVTPLLKKYRDWQCLWIGEHHFTYPEIKGRISQLGVQDSILCPGAIPRAGNKISGADLYLLPSITEAFPTVLLEARLAGLPFLANNCGGAEEIAAAGGGWCQSMKGAFSDKLDTCFQGDLKAPRLNSTAFSMETMTKGYHNIYQDTLSDSIRNAQRRQLILSSMLELGKDLSPLVEMEKKLERAMSWRGIGRWFRRFFGS
jgi:glycosyltransferase involved in cell wall biosynthesis